MKHQTLWEDFVRLMHLPLPFCVLAFATIGAAFAEHVYLDRLLLTYVGLLPALCLGAYCLDELHGRPYHTRFSDRTLKATAAAGITGSALVGIYLSLAVSHYIIVLSVLACFFVFAYNLELFGGRFHSAAWFGLSWGGLSTFGGFFVQAATVTFSALTVSLMAALVGVGILYLTHKFRPSQFSKHFDTTVSAADLAGFCRQARKIGWTIVKIESCAMILLAIALILPKIL